MSASRLSEFYFKTIKLITNRKEKPFFILLISRFQFQYSKSVNRKMVKRMKKGDGKRLH